MSSQRGFLHRGTVARSGDNVSDNTGDIEHTGFLSEDIGQLCLSTEYSDVMLVVENQHIPAHKVILAARSEYFRALLFGGMRETSQNEIELQGAPLQAFKALLRYVYSGHMALSTLSEDNVLDTLGLAHQFGFQKLESAISEYLRQILALRNVCAILDAARLYGLEGLTNVCHNFMDRNAQEVLQHESFLNISIESLKELLVRDSFFSPEVAVFRAVCNWCKANPHISKQNTGQSEAETILQCVRLPLMSLEDLLTVVRPFVFVTPDMLLDAIEEKTHTNSSNLRHRGQLIPEENVATAKYGSAVIQGEMRTALLDGSANYDMERGYTRHPIIEGSDNIGIIVKLGTPSIINYIKLLLWDRDMRSYGYYIDVSVNQVDWVRVVDHSTYYCRSWQHLFFKPRVVQYIKVVGTNNTVNMVFHAVSLEAIHTQNIPPLVDGLVQPNYNVATLALSATVVEGVSRCRNSLLDGNIENYDWDAGYTCHQLSSGAIVVQLAQPYIISSMRMLLWDCDDRNYSYYIETSVNDCRWDLAVDRTREACRSWQVVRFTPRPVVLIRIVGTQNSANEVFHLVHFECPAQEDFQSTAMNSKSSVSSNQVGEASGAIQQWRSSTPETPLLPTETALEAEEHELSD
ncbi:BTB (POZ) domain containing 9 [Arctopsyche grandis]|uniref:BTB (POZ) domain containing 9 n=1 Tax=Arctopsyche grandis TaxID=121162 RepID=UPI00406D7112